MNSMLCLIITLPTLLMLCIMMIITQYVSGKRQFYGVSLNSDYFEREEFKSLDKKFKILIIVGFFVFSLLTLVCVYKLKLYEITTISLIILYTIYQFVVYIYIHNEVKKTKYNLLKEVDDLELEKTKLVLDTQFINQKNLIIRKYAIYMLIPFIITIIVGIYAITQYNSLPSEIPSHWGVTGQIDAYTKKSIPSAFFGVFMSVALGIFMYITSVQSLKSRSKLVVDDIKENKELHLYYLNKFGFTFFVLYLALQVLFVSIVIATINVSNINPLILYSTTVTIVFIAFYQTYLYYKSPNKSKKEVYSVDDNDDNWIFGMIYNNKNDPSICVPKRFGAGWTINIGNTKGKLLFILPFIIAIVVIYIANKI